MKKTLLVMLAILLAGCSYAQEKRARDYGIKIGVFDPGSMNSITDVSGVKVGHTTLIIGDNVRTGVTAILPHKKNLYQLKTPAAIYIGNGYGKLTGISQVKELGNIETPIILTNTMSVPLAFDALISYTINQPGNENVRSVNCLVGETNDGTLNDIRGRHIKEDHVLNAISSADNGPVIEGNVGAGTGTICFGFKGGIGTASRTLPGSLGGYTIGVLVQSNFGGVLQLDGVPVGEELEQFSFSRQVLEKADGSCMIVVATDAPLDARNLERVAKRAIMGLAKTGGIASNGSGDYVIAFSVAGQNLIDSSDRSALYRTETLGNSAMSPIFMATIEATEEAIINSLFAAETMKGMGGRTIKELPEEKVVSLMKRYGKFK